jgi:GNAT superfamily N-acetyltransferase
LILDFAPPTEVVRELFVEYSRQLGVDLCVQNFHEELAALPGSYQLIVVAKDGEFPAGCAGLRPLEPGIAELKRLYVRDAYRGTGLGRRLTEAMIKEAVRMGYRSLRLDTLPGMERAIALYRSLGFREIAAYHGTTLPGLLYFELSLQQNTPPIACNLNAIDSTKRERHSDLRKRLEDTIRDRNEVADGYAFEIDGSGISLPEVAEWIETERLCCPFLTLQLSVFGDRAGWELKLTGPEGVKTFLQAEFPSLRAGQA